MISHWTSHTIGLPEVPSLHTQRPVHRVAAAHLGRLFALTCPNASPLAYPHDPKGLQPRQRPRTRTAAAFKRVFPSRRAIWCLWKK